MQAIHDIFGLWPSVGVMASELERGYDTVLAWRTRGRIPEDAWDDVIAAASKRGTQLSIGQIVAANAPIKKRGRAAHKVRKIRAKRNEARAS